MAHELLFYIYTRTVDMKKFAVVSLYLMTIMLVLSANQTRWFHLSTPQDQTSQKPLFNEVEAFARIWIAPQESDPDMKYNWALQSNGVMQMQKAWQLGSCDKNIIVAVIDTGMDYNHPDLMANLWKNPKEIPDNGTDDDENGFIDDEIGWDFVANDNLPYDEHGHGTHIAGIIGAVGGNGIGTRGICSQISLMILKYYDPRASGQQNLLNTVKAFQYAVNNGAHIINYSGGGAQASPEEKEAIAAAQKKNILVVAAAGNESEDAGRHAYYPASYHLGNIISVAAMTHAKTLVSSSNYGETIDVAAPGHNIYSTFPNGKYGFMTGTSQATAFVTGIAAMALSQNRTLSPKELKSLLMQSIDQVNTLKGKTKTGGVINAYSVLRKAF